MVATAVRGLHETISLFDRIPQALQPALGELLTEIGLEENAAQKAAVAQRTGHLERGLTFEVLIEQLRVRIGLLKYRSGRNSRYYGRFVEFGRRGQIVRVTRGTTVSAKSASTKRRLKAGLKVRGPYPMRVKAMAARPFIHRGDAQFEQRVARRTADFWSQVLDRAGANA